MIAQPVTSQPNDHAHNRSHRRTGFTVVEIALVIVILAGLLAGMASAYRYALTRAQVADTRALLDDLRKATHALRQIDGQAVTAARDGDAVLDALCTHAITARMLNDQSANLWQCVDGHAHCADAWGTPLRYIATSGADDALRRRLQLAGGEAIFESAGPDRDFGDENPARQTDNLRSDEPAPPVPTS